MGVVPGRRATCRSGGAEAAPGRNRKVEALHESSAGRERRHRRDRAAEDAPREIGQEAPAATLHEDAAAAAGQVHERVVELEWPRKM